MNGAAARVILRPERSISRGMAWGVMSSFRACLLKRSLDSLFRCLLVLARHDAHRLEEVGHRRLFRLLAGTNHVAVELDRRFEGDRVHASELQLPDHGAVHHGVIGR